MLQDFELFVGMAIFIMRTAKFEPDVIRTGYYFGLRLTTTSITQRTSKGPGPFAVATSFGVLLPEINTSLL